MVSLTGIVTLAALITAKTAVQISMVRIEN
jgi:hypothetical protein